MAAVISSARTLIGNSGGNSRRKGNGWWEVGGGTKRLEIRSSHGNDKPFMQQPPLLPERVLARVRSIAHKNGLSVVLIASIAAVLEASRGLALTAIAGLFAAGAGAMEMHGAGLLRHGHKQGMIWLIRAELLLLAVIWIYCGVRLAQPDLSEL